MKSYINKIFAGVAVAATLGLGSCVNDLDLLPIDPSVETPANIADNPKEFIGMLMAKCYSSLAVSGQYGPDGGADISGLDGGTSQYTRAIFMMNEFTTDEVSWIWPDVGVVDLNTNTWSSSNANIFGTYSRLMVHISVCNDFIRTTSASNLSNLEVSVDAALQKDIDQFQLEARALRALSYYYMIDIFGQVSWAWDDMPYGESPAQVDRKTAFTRVVADLEDVLSKFPSSTPVYGRLGKDAVEALLCKFYLNAEVFTGQANWAKCWEHAQNIIARHQGGGFDGSGLANDYLALFCGNNDMFAPGGSLPAQNEILWVIPYNSTYTQPYGGCTFLINAAVKAQGSRDNLKAGYQAIADYAGADPWGCMHAREQFSNLFGFQDGVSADKRTWMWCTDSYGFKITNDNFSEFNDGYAAMKFTNLLANPDGTLPRRELSVEQTDGSMGTVVLYGDETLNDGRSTKFPDTDYPMIRLADVYLMAAEATINGAGDKELGRKYASYVRQRAGLPAWRIGDMTKNNILNERARELYWENVRRTDLIRHGKFTGSSYVWNWKGNSAAGTSIPSYMNLMPIPADILATQPSFKQNPGY